MTPIFIISRDRLSPLQALVEWLEKAGHERIVIIDNGSTYEPLLEWYDTIVYPRVRLGNDGAYSFWSQDVRGRMGYPHDERFVLTDSDVVPDEDCPLDAVEHFAELMDRHAAPKVGFGLRTDDLPDCYEHKAAVLGDEPQYYVDEIEPGVFRAILDTTFALYEPTTRAPSAALRTGAPYMARHTTWYEDSEHLTEEQAYYKQHAKSGNGFSIWGAR